jgi:hypothetical protein
VRDFGRCFEGLEPAQAEALADGFQFERCAVRKPLAELLASFLHVPVQSSSPRSGV